MARNEPKPGQPPPEDSLGQRLRRARRARQLTQVRLAGLADVDQAVISRLETGERVRGEDASLARIAGALEVDVVWLREGTGTPPPEVVSATALEPPAARFHVLDRLLDEAFVVGRHRPTDIAYLRHLLLSEAPAFVARAPAPLDEYVEAARYWLDAISRLRGDEQAVTLTAILLDSAREMGLALVALRAKGQVVTATGSGKGRRRIRP